MTCILNYLISAVTLSSSCKSVSEGVFQQSRKHEDHADRSPDIDGFGVGDFWDAVSGAGHCCGHRQDSCHTC